MSFKKMILTLAAPAALLSLSACVTGFPAQVSRFQAMPAPQGQSFVVQPADREKAGSLEFSQYADHVRRNLTALGYAEARSQADATFVVTLDYGVDQGRERVETYPDPFGYGGFGGFGYGGFGRGGFGAYGRPYFSRFGYYGRHRSPFFWGWHDPFWGGGYDVTSYTIYTSFLDMDIKRTADGQSLFEGLAQARSRIDDLPVLVPNLIEAMFTGFPGNSGERVRITVMPEREQR